jgi:hypothetical protein
MTVGELECRMTTRELGEWMAYVRHFQAIPDSWAQTGLLVSALMAPHSKKGQCPKASDFNPIEPPPQHAMQARDVIIDLKKQLGFD